MIHPARPAFGGWNLPLSWLAEDIGDPPSMSHKSRCCLRLARVTRCDSRVFLRFRKRIACICGISGKFSAPTTAHAPLIRCRERIGPMTKNELIAAVADKAQMTKTAAASAVDATFDAITATLKKGGEVKIMGFGNFRVVKRAAREGRDPRTGAPVKIRAAKRPRFSAGKGLKDAVNR
jgi:DNA-binding protein HU-beta